MNSISIYSFLLCYFLFCSQWPISSQQLSTDHDYLSINRGQVNLFDFQSINEYDEFLFNLKGRVKTISAQSYEYKRTFRFYNPDEFSTIWKSVEDSLSHKILFSKIYLNENKEIYKIQDYGFEKNFDINTKSYLYSERVYKNYRKKLLLSDVSYHSDGSIWMKHEYSYHDRIGSQIIDERVQSWHSNQYEDYKVDIDIVSDGNQTIFIQDDFYKKFYQGGKLTREEWYEGGYLSQVCDYQYKDSILVKKNHFGIYPPTDIRKSIQIIEYDTLGRKTRETAYLNNTENSVNYDITLLYEKNGRLKERIADYFLLENFEATKYYYSGIGNQLDSVYINNSRSKDHMKSIKEPMGVSKYYYNENGDLIRKWDGFDLWWYDYTYDSHGNWIKKISYEKEDGSNTDSKIKKHIVTLRTIEYY